PHLELIRGRARRAVDALRRLGRPGLATRHDPGPRGGRSRARDGRDGDEGPSGGRDRQAARAREAGRRALLLREPAPPRDRRGPGGHGAAAGAAPDQGGAAAEIGAAGGGRGVGGLLRPRRRHRRTAAIGRGIGPAPNAGAATSANAPGLRCWTSWVSHRIRNWSTNGISGGLTLGPLSSSLRAREESAHAEDGGRQDSQRCLSGPPGQREDLAERGDPVSGGRDQPPWLGGGRNDRLGCGAGREDARDVDLLEPRLVRLAGPQDQPDGYPRRAELRG